MQEYDIIRRARAMLEASENGSPSMRTIAGYEARARRIFKLVKGVRLSIIGSELVAEISGSKVTEKSGQPWRRLSWSVDSDSPLVVMLVAEVRNGLDVAKIDDAKRYSGAVRAAGEREWPRRKAKVSPYCLRHAAASDMKASELEDSLISQALGHCADVARSYYGQSQMGAANSGVIPQSVQAARLVKKSTRAHQPQVDRSVRKGVS